MRKGRRVSCDCCLTSISLSLLLIAYACDYVHAEPEFVRLSPEEIDRMVTESWPRPLRPILLEIEPYHSAILDIFMIHAGQHAGL